VAELRIGISGWTYAPWRGVFYPRGLPHRRELEFASRQVSSIEINGSFYSLQRPESYLKWYSATPEGFVFAVKGGRFITHMLKLKRVRTPLANFFASGVLALREKLGPILWQFPASFKYDPARFREFLELLPRDSGSALELAREHDRWLKGRTWLDPQPERILRHAVEVRHPSFADPAFSGLLREYGVALVVSHSSGHWPIFEEMTADFVYVRLHGEGKLYEGEYGRSGVGHWARKLKRWTRGPAHVDAYVYFDNDRKVKAPGDAIALLRKVTDFEPRGILEAA
jgi:uncharacterized protein YecE (DUF72 family)